MSSTLRLLAQHGRFVLVIGLVAGLALPQVASAMRPWLGELVLLLLFLNAFRVGLPSAMQVFKHAQETLPIIFTYQLVMPLLCLALFFFFGSANSSVAIALVLMLSAPPVTGSPNMSIMLGHPPDHAFRLLLLGTLLLPLTLIPIFWLSPEFGSLITAVKTSLRLGLSICTVVAVAFILRAAFRPQMEMLELQALDGITSITLAIIVIGLMSAVTPALSNEPLQLARWMLVATGANFGMQILAYWGQKSFALSKNISPNALVAGNRNIALFLVATNATQSEEFLMFLGCYQIPMYLTPIIMRPLLGNRSKPDL